MRLVLFGATGMIGKGALLEALDEPTVEQVLAVVRKPTGLRHEKLVELLHPDFQDYRAVEERFAAFDACLWCLGVSAAGSSQADYRRITYDYAVSGARALLRASPRMRLCFVSGAGTDVHSRQLWARVKGETEQSLLAMPWRSAHMFRPGVIQPMRGVVSGVDAYRMVYRTFGWTFPLWKALAPGAITTTVVLGRALIRVARDGCELSVLETRDINRLGS